MGICDSCLSELQPNSPEVERSEGIDYRLAVYRYSGRASQAVLRLKYSRATALGEPMANLLASRAIDMGLLEGVEIVPVPIHWTRRAWRGFNQAELLCARLPREAMHRSWLRRVRATKSQAGLSAEQRQRNLQGAFVASAQVKGRNILLVDDVVTTGHTAIACAEALYEMGALEVGIIAFAGNPVDYRQIVATA